MIYICSHIAPKYQLDCAYTFIDNNDLSLLNIAYEGNRYRHLRGIYNLYRNYDLPDEIGIFQYKRYLSATNIPDSYRCVVPKFNVNYTISSIYQDNHNIEDLYLIEKILNDNDFSNYIRSLTFEQYYHNMFILYKPDFYEYCKFVFDVLFEFDKLTQNKNYKGDNEPVCAFLGERLGSYWIYKNIPKDKIYLAEVVEM